MRRCRKVGNRLGQVHIGKVVPHSDQHRPEQSEGGQGGSPFIAQRMSSSAFSIGAQSTRPASSANNEGRSPPSEPNLRFLLTSSTTSDLPISQPIIVDGIREYKRHQALPAPRYLHKLKKGRFPRKGNRPAPRDGSENEVGGADAEARSLDFDMELECARPGVEVRYAGGAILDGPEVAVLPPAL